MDLLAFGFLYLISSNAERFSGMVNQNSKSGVGFMAKFCFDVNHESNSNATVGSVSVELKSPYKQSGETFLALFDDQINSWPKIYEKSVNCTEAKSSLKGKPFSLSWRGQHAPYTASFELKRISQNLRPRWWFITLINCDSNLKEVTYNVHAVQAQSSAWDKEFGVNEQGLNTLNLVFFFYYLVFFAIHTVGFHRLGKQLEYTHPLVRLFYVVVLVMFLVIFSRLLHYGIFAQNGEGVPELAKFAEVAEIFVRVVFLIILMLLAKGWTINPGEISGKRAVLLFSAAFLFAEVGIVFWRYAVQDPAATAIPTGLAFMLYAVVALWFLWTGWFVVIIYTSWKTEVNPVKKSLFQKLALIYFPWFFGLPFITMLQFAIDPWVREKIIASIRLLIATAGYSFLSYLLWPTRAEEYFSISSPDPLESGLDNYEQL